METPFFDSAEAAAAHRTHGGVRDLGRVSIVASCLWAVGFVAYVALVGIPEKRSNVLLWVVLAILAIGASQLRRTLISLVRDWMPVLSALVAYDLLRGMSDNANRTIHVDPQFAVDRWLGRGTIPTVRLQSWLHATAAVHWYDFAAWGVYMSHFLLPWAAAIGLWAVASSRFRPFLYGFALLSWMALATYYLYPAEPPWMIARQGLTHHDVTRLVHSVWKHVGVERAARVFQPVDPSHAGAKSDYANPVAALPSLHAAYPMFIAIMLWSKRRWANVLLALYPPAMALALVYTGEHFVVDVLLGWTYAAIAASVSLLIARRMRRPALEDELEQLAARYRQDTDRTDVRATVPVE